MQPAASAPAGAARTDRPAQGWFRDPSGAHQDRWFSDGMATHLVRDGDVESFDDPPPFDYDSQPLVPVSPDGADEPADEPAEPDAAADEAGEATDEEAEWARRRAEAAAQTAELLAGRDRLQPDPAPEQVTYVLSLTVSMVLTVLIAGWALLQTIGTGLGRCFGACYPITNQWAIAAPPLAEALLALAAVALLLRSLTRPAWSRAAARFSWEVCGAALLLVIVLSLA